MNAATYNGINVPMQHIASGRLVRVLQDRGPKYSGYNLCYPSKRQPSPALSLVVKTLRL